MLLIVLGRKCGCCVYSALEHTASSTLSVFPLSPGGACLAQNLTWCSRWLISSVGSLQEPSLSALRTQSDLLCHTAS